MDDIDPAVLAAVMAAQEAEDNQQEEQEEPVDEAVLAAVMAAAEAEQNEEEDAAAEAAMAAQAAEAVKAEEVKMEEDVVEEVKMEEEIVEDIKPEVLTQDESSQDTVPEEAMEVVAEVKEEQVTEGDNGIPGIVGPTPEDIIQKMEDEKELEDFVELVQKNSLVGLLGLFLEPEGMYCKNCQKSLSQDLIVNHVVGEGHKLNTLWHYDKNIANVAGKLRAYPEKFEIELRKHIAMLIKFELRAINKIEKPMREKLFDLFPDLPEEPQSSQEQEEASGSDEPQMTQEELAVLKAEFIASFYDPAEMMLVNSALSGDLTKFKNTEEAITALKVISDLGKVISSYQRKRITTGYRVDKDCILDIKKQCGDLLKSCDNMKLKHG